MPATIGHEEEIIMRIVAMVLSACALSTTLNAQVPDFTPKTPLIGALLHNDVAEAKRLLAGGADPNESGFLGMPPILLAILRQDVDLVRMMVARGADLNARDRSGATALMWAAFNETGDARLVEALLELGADPAAANQAGETALVWALRRGDTPVVSALRRAGAAETALTKASVEKAIALLQKSSSQFNRVSGCYSCHHQSLPEMAFAAARAHGVAVDETAARQQVDVTIKVLNSVAEPALRNRDRIPDPPIAVSYALVGLAAERYEADATTAAMASVIAAWQSDDGAFYPLPAIRPPLEADAFTATALSLRALRLYGSSPEERIARARDWLRTATPRTTQERAMQLLGLTWAGASAVDIRTSATALLAEQRPDGGWAQLPTLETDAYATGQALVALQTAGQAVSSAEYRRGAAYLLRTQFADGSWLVRSRTFPVQPLRDTGFPHGKHQWISAAGTSWAAMALALTLPEQPGTAP
jgi:Ankyrin repeats (3 copies)